MKQVLEGLGDACGGKPGRPERVTPLSAEALKEGVGMSPEANPLPMPEPERVGKPEEQ